MSLKIKVRTKTLRTFNKKNCLIMMDESLRDWQKSKDRYNDANASLDRLKAETILSVLGFLRIAMSQLKEKPKSKK